ncbi:MAG: SBBP repeat-containing protein, partial [bacterium]
VGEMPLALFDVTVDPAQLSATITPVGQRRAQDNDDVYALPLDAFRQPQTLRVESVANGMSTLDLSWRFTHPFASSTVTNRADLGFSGYLVLLVDDSNAVAYFDDGTDAVRANTSLVQNAQSYVRPGGLLDLSGYTCNTFPAQLIADDAGLGNVIDAATESPISNGGDPKGNFGPLGWQTLPSETWRGFDVLHQGQAARGMIQLDRATLDALGTLQFKVAIIGHYNDPVSGLPHRLHRLPSTPPNVLTQFGYRMPHGALDVSVIADRGESGGLVAGVESTTDLRFQVRDWDARAVVATGVTDLAAVAWPNQILESEAGPPAVEVSLPAILGPDILNLGALPADNDLPIGGDVQTDSGMPGDELYYPGTLIKPADPTIQGGQYVGMVRVTDVAAGNQPYLTPLHGDLTPVLANPPLPVRYQTFTVMVADDPATAGWARGFGGNDKDTARSVVTDPDGNVYVTGNFAYSADFGGGTRTSDNGFRLFLAKYTARGEYLWDRVYDANSLDIGAVDIAIDAQRSVYITSRFRNDTVQFDPSGPVHLNHGYYDICLLKVTTDGDYLWSKTFGNSGLDEGRSVTVTPNGTVVVGGVFVQRIDFDGLELEADPDGSGFLFAINQVGGPVKWATAIVGSKGADVSAVAARNDGHIVACGSAGGVLHLGSQLYGAGMTDFSWVVDVNGADGTLDGWQRVWNWDVNWGASFYGVAVNPANNDIALTGLLAGVVDFGLGVLNGDNRALTMFMLGLDSGGTPVYSFAPVPPNMFGI